MMKNTSFVKKMRQNHRMTFFEENVIQVEDKTVINDEGKKAGYQKLRDYYISMFRMIDMMHYNSTVTESVYRKYIGSVAGKVIDISNKDILNHKHLKDISNNIRLAFLAAPSSIKGYGILRQALDGLWEEGYRNFELHSYGNSAKSERYLFTHPRYKHEELKQIMDYTDMVIVPSCWNETFGFVVLEALSYGVPVLLSERVGAKDIIDRGKTGIIVSPDANSLKAEIRKVLDSPIQCLRGMNEYIVNNQTIKTMDMHTKEMVELYEEIRRVY
ncbi:MAG: glycosyltransferase [Muricomes sp.]